MKIVIIGAGSYVFTPTVIEDLIITSKLQDCEIVLVDLNMEVVDLLAKITRRIAEDNGIRVKVTASTDRKNALYGADYVINTAAIQGAKRWLMDYEICLDEGIPHECREAGALSGISYGFRTIKLMMDICRDIENLCPKAKLMSVSNPLTKVHEAIHRYTNVDAYGFCNVAQGGAHGYDLVANILGRSYKEIYVVSAGVNHFSWIVSIKDKVTGADLFPEYLNKLYESSKHNKDHEIVWQWYEEYGAIAAPPVDHACEFLPYQSNIKYIDTPPFHGSESERLQRIEEMKQMASGELDYRNVDYFLGASWEHPGLVIGAIKKQTFLHLNALNVPNVGYLPQLPEGAIIEVPAEVKDSKIQPYKDIYLPEKTVDICMNQCIVSGMVAQAAVENNYELAKNIIDIDISITHKTAAKNAIKRMIAAHSDILTK